MCLSLRLNVWEVYILSRYINKNLENIDIIEVCVNNVYIYFF